MLYIKWNISSCNYRLMTRAITICIDFRWRNRQFSPTLIGLIKLANVQFESRYVIRNWNMTLVTVSGSIPNSNSQELYRSFGRRKTIKYLRSYKRQCKVKTLDNKRAMFMDGKINSQNGGCISSKWYRSMIW